MLKLEEKTQEIKKRRKLLGLTQKELAGRSRVSQSLVAKLESGKIDPSYSSVQKIDSALTDLEKLNMKKELKAGDIMNSPVAAARIDEKINKVVKTMWNKGFSQMPVFDGEIPVGSISEEDILKAHEEYGKNKMRDLNVKEIMNDSFPIVNEGAQINSIRELLKESKAVLVSKGKKFGIITKSDFLRA
ncbi:MAG: CBS domain-containing protein [archaeon]|nr:MAG: CBS domain-containing protein [archaeon]